jgi:flagellar biosynthesis/type III secretory pathway protein FliH
MTSSSDGTGLRLPELAGRAGARVVVRPRPLDVDEGGVWRLPSLRHDGRPELPTETELAHREGFAAGRAQGGAEVRRELAPALQALARVTEVLEAERANFLRTRERNLEALALAVAGRLAGREVAAEPELVRGLLDRALALLPLDATVEVRLHPSDLALIEAAQAEQRDEATPERAITWVPDPAQERGGFVIESPLRLVDGRFDVALRTLYDRLER